MRAMLGKLMPGPLKVALRDWLNQRRRKLMAPRMLWGYRDASGQWRPRTRVSDTAHLYHPERISLADNVFLGHYTILDGTGELEICEGVQVAAMAAIFTHSSHIAIRLYGKHYVEVDEYAKAGYPIANMRIGRYAFIGAGARILPGVSIGNGALVAAGAIVNCNVGDFQVVSGNPAVVVGDTRELDAKYLQDPQLKAWYDEWQEN